MLSALLGAVGRIKGRHSHPVLSHVLQKIGEGSVAGHFPGGQALRVGRIVPRGRHLGAAQLAAVVAHVEDLRRNVVEEREEAANALGNVRLALFRCLLYMYCCCCCVY